MADDEKLSSLSRARNREEMADFWDRHDAADFEGQTHEVEMQFDLQARRHYIAIDADVLAELRQAALRHGVSVESLANLWLQERALSSKRHVSVAAEPRTEYKPTGD